ncbi:MAG TPA: uroporphyrinogen decarboxylase family protein [Candidatus Brocadiia bacterium]|nr:uroporphyrinogen decarboxylase family protein [Candidatus Brocadiia bacterium]
MDGREIVRRTVHFERPKRIAMSLPAPYPNDFLDCGASPSAGWKEKRWQEGNMELWTDEWGCTWGRLGGISKGEVLRSPIETWDDFETYIPPDIDNPARYERARKIFSENKDKFRLGHIHGFAFNCARYLRRMDRYLADVALEPEKILALNRMVDDKFEGAIRCLAAAGADGIMFGEDWGTQDRLLINPTTWREMFKPGYIRLCGVCRELGMDVFMHSCGYIFHIIEDLIEVGINVLQFDQPALHGIDNLSVRFGGRVAFWCPVDIQRTLQTRDPETIRSAAREMIGKLGGFGGGFIAGYYGDNVAIGLTPDVQDHACRAFVESGNYDR